MEERLWSVDEVALWSNVSLSTVRRWIRTGKLVGQKVGVQWRFDPAAVREAFQRGTLSGASRPLSGIGAVTQYREPPQWAKPVLERWRHFLEDQLKEVRPDHVVVNDRRGAKIWKLVIPEWYIWGKNLWHSTAAKLMPQTELRQTFGHRRVLLFDEMMQHGREIHELRQLLEAKDVSALVTSLVCVRRRSHAESGELLEYKALYCEDLDDSQFAERAALISRLAYLFEPPLDVDHLVVKGTFLPGLKTEDLLERAAKWGIPFVVWFADKEHESIAITLDRPQFFDTKISDLPSGFSFGWEGPGKVRIYGNPENGPCYCSFIVYPDMEAPMLEWEKVSVDIRRPKRGTVTANGSSLLYPKADEAAFRRAYATVCINLAVKLFTDFVTSGAAEETGIHFDNSHDAIDVGQLQATFGLTRGSEVAKRVREILALTTRGRSLFPQVVQNPLPLLIRRDPVSQKSSCDIFNCRAELLRAIPQRYSLGGEHLRPISWSELLRRLPQFPESTIGRVFDDDLDTGAAKPVIWVDYLSRDGAKIAKVWRGFCRGEFGPWFEWDRHVLGHQDIVIQRTIGLGPTVVENFLKRIGEPRMLATYFDKTFANLEHDLCEGAHDSFYLGWRPYKYGPVPVVPVVSPSGEFMEFQRFLVGMRCLSETRERHGSQVWRKYEPADDKEVPWRNIYRLRTSAVTRAHVAGLVRLYAAIQKQCTTMRPSVPGKRGTSVFQDPLVVLAAARNTEVAYKCAWFEVHDWRAKGQLLFPLLDGIAVVRQRPPEPFLKQHLEDFAEPARLLFDKIEMYRNIAHLRQQIVNLLSRGDFEAGEVLLESIDPSPKFESHSEWPMQNLEWACRTMRAFSSMTRQVLTACELDVDERTDLEKVDDRGVPKDASYYLNELLTNCPELRTLEDNLRTCITNSGTGYLTEDISGCLSRTFRLILNVFDIQQRIPDPRPQRERNNERSRARADLLTIFREIALPQPYAIAVADIRNLRNLPRVADVFGVTFEQAMDNLLKWVEKAARNVAKRHAEVHFAGLSGDSVILAGSNVDDVFLAVVDLIRQTTRRLIEIDYNQFAPFGLLRAGIAWREDGMGEEFQAVRPGIIAHDLANQPEQELGAVNITKAVFDRLSPEHQSTFTETTQDSGQGKVFVRHWNPDRDLT